MVRDCYTFQEAAVFLPWSFDAAVSIPAFHRQDTSVWPVGWQSQGRNFRKSLRGRRGDKQNYKCRNIYRLINLIWEGNRFGKDFELLRGQNYAPPFSCIGVQTPEFRRMNQVFASAKTPGCSCMTNIQF